ncbi:MAG: type 4a pilus biogenesis protein PilO [Phycisphaerales bacterium]|nr:type II secretion system protein M [Phycisphaerae bacterium]NNF41622.1 type 4a pilus biogenesis protein PilO [Phycisphaerales bacterium]NNM24572.1 type 4a pilus biogenesis protein PilO [Phycisphaerales bacterium]
MRIDRGQCLFLVVLILLVVTFVFGLWLPRRQRAEMLEHDIAVAQRELAAVRDRPIVEPVNPIDAERLRQESEIALPRQPQLGPLLERLSADLEAVGLTVRELRAESVVRQSEVDRIPILLECSGTYAGLRELIRRIEDYERLVRIDRLGVSGDAVAAPGNLDAGMELSTFIRVAEDAP